MEQVNKSNPILFGVGVLAMMLSLSLFAFTLYIVPHIVFGAEYDVPEFIVIVTYWYTSVQGLSGIRLALTVIMPYLLSGTILAFIAKRLTKRVEGGENKIGDFSKQSFMELLHPAFYEIILISVVLISLFFAVFVIVVKFD